MENISQELEEVEQLVLSVIEQIAELKALAVRNKQDIFLLLQALGVSTATQLKIRFEQGDPGMAGTVQEGLKIRASDVEFNAEGDVVAASDPSKLTYAVDDATVVQLLTSADDPSIPVGEAVALGLKVGTANVTSTDNALTPPLVSDPTPLAVTLDPVASKLVVNFG